MLRPGCSARSPEGLVTPSRVQSRCTADGWDSRGSGGWHLYYRRVRCSRCGSHPGRALCHGPPRRPRVPLTERLTAAADEPTVPRPGGFAARAWPTREGAVPLHGPWLFHRVRALVPSGWMRVNADPPLGIYHRPVPKLEPHRLWEGAGDLPHRPRAPSHRCERPHIRIRRRTRRHHPRSRVGC